MRKPKPVDAERPRGEALRLHAERERDAQQPPLLQPQLPSDRNPSDPEQERLHRNHERQQNHCCCFSHQVHLLCSTDNQDEISAHVSVPLGNPP